MLNRVFKFLRITDRADTMPTATIEERLLSLKKYIDEGTEAEQFAPLLDRWLDDLEVSVLKEMAGETPPNPTNDLVITYRTALKLRKAVQDSIDKGHQKKDALERFMAKKER